MRLRFINLKISNMCTGTFYSIYHFFDLISKIVTTVSENVLGNTLECEKCFAS
jgi:hypothetical protein